MPSCPGSIVGIYPMTVSCSIKSKLMQASLARSLCLYWFWKASAQWKLPETNAVPSTFIHTQCYKSGLEGRNHFSGALPSFFLRPELGEVTGLWSPPKLPSQEMSHLQMCWILPFVDGLAPSGSFACGLCSQNPGTCWSWLLELSAWDVAMEGGCDLCWDGSLFRASSC